ncbi:sugar ABC transporter permease [uncultured Sphaerochaeta sp.]|uniref:carbohydrate ABC transporter permease n=1 Tax=uncultured Sphaerochaeta sp. TaxID=886478 RepID=UPI002A0A5FB2|nr:sugar ABC transporter permease [uncultured Sphaerochaeta sp.]
MQRNLRYKQETWTAVRFISPFFLFFIIFKFYPLVYGIVVSFLDRNSIRKLNSTVFMGITNYVRVLSSATVRLSFLHTLQYSVIYVSLTMILALLMAVFLNKKFVGRTAVRTMFYIPYVTNLIAVGIVWKYLLNPFEGPINTFLGNLGLRGDRMPQWLSGTSMALPTTAFISTWVTLAFSVITLLAALQEIPATFFEVAEIEGVSRAQRLRYLILPALKPTLGFLLMMNVINSFKNYTVVVALTNGGPGNATRVASFQIYEDAFQYYKFSYSSAYAVLLTLFILLVTLVLMKLRKCWEED